MHKYAILFPFGFGVKEPKVFLMPPLLTFFPIDMHLFTFNFAFQRVRDPAHGFFIAGSSLPNLNGIYGRVRNEHVQFLSGVKRHRPVRLAYRHDKTGWLMVLVDISPEERPDSEEEDYDVRYGFKEPYVSLCVAIGL